MWCENIRETLWKRIKFLSDDENCLIWWEISPVNGGFHRQILTATDMTNISAVLVEFLLGNYSFDFKKCHPRPLFLLPQWKHKKIFNLVLDLVSPLSLFLGSLAALGSSSFVSSSVLFFRFLGSFLFSLIDNWSTDSFLVLLFLESFLESLGRGTSVGFSLQIFSVLVFFDLFFASSLLSGVFCAGTWHFYNWQKYS